MSKTDTDTNISTHHNNLYGNYGNDVHSILNFTMTGMVTKELMNILNSGDTLNSRKIIKLFAIMSLDELRKIIMTSIKKISSLLCENYLSIIKWINENIINNFVFKIMIHAIKFIIKKITFITDKIKTIIYHKKNISLLPVENITTLPVENITSLSTEIDINKSFMKILINYIIKQKNISDIYPLTSYDTICNPKIIVENLEKIKINETWNNIKLEWQDYIMYIENTLSLDFIKIKGKLSFNGNGDSDISNKIINIDNHDFSKIKTLSDLMPESKIKTDMKEFLTIEGIYKAENAIYSTHGLVKIHHYWFNTTKSSNYSDINKEQIFIEYLQTFIPSLNAYSSLVELIYLLNISNNITFFNIKFNITDELIIFNYKIIINQNNIKYFPYDNCILYAKTNNNPVINKILNNRNIGEKFYFIDKKIGNSTSQSQSQNLTSIKFYLKSNKYNTEQLNDKFMEFIEFINSYTEDISIKKPVNSYTIGIQTTIKTEKIKNVEYESYMSQKQTLLDLLSQCKTNDQTSNSVYMNCTMELNKFMAKEVPVEYIEKTIEEKKVVEKLVNEIYKKQDTLYLRKDDMDKLNNSLHMFLEDKDFLDDLGIQHKLGILLHGLAGTGKSSTVNYIATYLKKNIYCVDFKTIKTNNDFMEIINYVNKNCVNGGILTFEDIDTMGDVLYKRVKISEDSLVELCSKIDQDLTLDYILNVFQGSLTPSGFVFIATTNHLNVLDEALYRDGRFDIKIDMKLCDHYQIQSIYKKIMKRQISDELLLKIKEDTYRPVSIIYHIKDYVRSDHSDEFILKPFIS
jgi:ATP-dependent 26S proteasome regulatory subunit